MFQRGMVTFELAIGMLSAALVATVLGWAVSLLMVQARCTDVAGQIARQLGRGDQEAAAQIVPLAPVGAQVEVTSADGLVTVRVAVDERLGIIGPVTVVGSATAPQQGR